MKLLFLTLFILLFSGFASVNAQQAVLAAGQSVSGTGSVSYSIGQVVYTAHSANQISVTQGVQQTYGGPLVSGLDEAKALQIAVYPNPTSEWVSIHFQNGFENCSFQLVDESGKLIQTANITEVETKVPMDQLASGTYFLKISRSAVEVEISKIVKSN